MAKNTPVARKVQTGTFAPSALGSGKARKFALIEGLELDAKSKAASALAQSRGLKGDAFRASVAGQLLNKPNK